MSTTLARVMTLSTCLVLQTLQTQAVAGEKARTLYSIDPTHSSIEFTVPFMGIARVSGSFNQFYGTVEHGEENLNESSAEVVIRVASIDTRFASRDNDLRSEKYFDVERFPVMVFRSKEIEAREGGPVLIGDLMIRDTTRKVELPFSILGTLESEGGREMGAEATTSFDRREFGISRGQFSGDQVFIGNEVTINIMLRLREPSAEKKQMATDHPALIIEDNRLRSFVGHYRDDDQDQELSVHFLAGELSLERGGKLLRMIPIGEAEFRLQDFAAFVSFDTEGTRPTLLWERPGRDSQTYFAKPD